jgi:pimeloyl-ACP methyl ester carboxylesterase
MEYDAGSFASAADGTRLFYGARGPAARDGAPALILLDGIGCDGWAWNHIQPHLAVSHRVLHLHYRGHGRSGTAVDPQAIDILTLSDDVVRVLDAAQVDDAIVLAHSMGTQVALELYRRAPERVRALVLICGSYGRITHTFHGNDILHRVLPKLIELVQKHRGVARALWGRLPSQLAFKIAGWLGEIDGVSLAASDFAQYVEHLSDIDLDLYLAMLQQAGNHSAEDVLPQVKVPTLVISAEKDTFTPVDVTRELADHIPGAQYMELKGASHAAPVERAKAINERVDAFLAELSVAPATPERGHGER